MKKFVRELVRDLSGRTQHLFAELLVEQLDATIEASRLVDEVVRGHLGVPAARAAMTRVEHAGDSKRAQLIYELSRCLTTPIDREDIFRLSRSVDDVLDNLRDFLREAELFEPVNLQPFRRVLPPILEALTCLRTASAALVKLSPEISLQTLAARKASNSIRKEYEIVLAGVFINSADSEVLKQRELVRRLDVVGLRIAEAANALADGYIKRAGLDAHRAEPVDNGWS
ncbi:MAG: DUF47 family protein [Acidimicrobiales bacterium]|jgi:hypothetical protein